MRGAWEASLVGIPDWSLSQATLSSFFEVQWSKTSNLNVVEEWVKSRTMTHNKFRQLDISLETWRETVSKIIMGNGFLELRFFLMFIVFLVGCDTQPL